MQKVFVVIGVYILFFGFMDVNATFVYQNDSIFASELSLDTTVQTDSVALSVDSLVASTDSLVTPTDSLAIPIDSIVSDSIDEPKKEMLDAEVQYQARDSIVFLIHKSRIDIHKSKK